MAIVTFSVRMEKALKEHLDALCIEFGMNTSVAINIFARAVVREHRIPFEISAASSTRGLRAFYDLRRQARNNGLQEMSLDEINAEITRSREHK